MHTGRGVPEATGCCGFGLQNNKLSYKLWVRYVPALALNPSAFSTENHTPGRPHAFIRGRSFCCQAPSTFSLGVQRYRILTMPDQLVSEPIKPLTETADTSRMAIGEPGLPQKFIWRDRTISVTAVIRSWRETGKCRHGSPEMYVRKHWYEVETSSDGTMKLYFERRPRRGQKGARWWLFSICEIE